MSTDYREMWKGLGLDLEAHDMLLGVLGPLYEQTFMHQANRPAGMQYFDFVMSEVHGLRIKELLDAKQAGRKVVGSFCTFVPEEIVLGLDGVMVGLCAGAEFATAEAEKYLPRNTCALIKGAFGFALARVCPYLSASDVIVGENTCDGKKKGYEIFKDLVPRLYQMDLPQAKSAEGRALMMAEFGRFAKYLEELTGRKLTVEALRKGISTANAKRGAMQRLAKLRAADPAPISGLDGLLANQVYFYDDPARFTGSVNKICDELGQRVAKQEGVAPTGTPRIVISGCPMAVPNWKLPAIVERAGAVIVGEESCVGERGTQNLTVDTGRTVDELMDAIVDRYLKIDCAIFTPNPSRVEHVRQMVKGLGAHGVIHYGLQFCAPYQIEAGPVERTLEKAACPRCASTPTTVRRTWARSRPGWRRSSSDCAGSPMRSAGIDIGSRAVKLVLVEDGRVVLRSVEDTGSDPLAVCRRLLDGVGYDVITGTGYGRHLFKEHWPAVDVITEIRAVAVGVAALVPGCRTVVDIGGQDSKVIELDAAGKVQKFVMNDRCAAGTGQFLEMMATTLAYTRDEFEAAAAGAARSRQLSSLCTVFAQTEVVSLIARGAPREEIALGVHQAVAARTHALAGGVEVLDPVVFTGGCACNQRLASLLSSTFKRSLRIPDSPQTVAALGGALHGAAEHRRALP